MDPTVEEILQEAKKAYDRINAEERVGIVFALLMDEERNTFLVLCQPPTDDLVETDLRRHFSEGARFIALELIPLGKPEFISLRELTVDEQIIIASQVKVTRYMGNRNREE